MSYNFSCPPEEADSIDCFLLIPANSSLVDIIPGIDYNATDRYMDIQYTSESGNLFLFQIITVMSRTFIGVVVYRRKRTIQYKTTESSMFLVSGHTKTGQVHQYQRKITSLNFNLINKPIFCKRDVLWVFEAKMSTELFVSNWFLQSSKKYQEYKATNFVMQKVINQQISKLWEILYDQYDSS